MARWPQRRKRGPSRSSEHLRRLVARRRWRCSEQPPPGLLSIEGLAAVRSEARQARVLLPGEERLALLERSLLDGGRHMLALTRERRVTKRDAADKSVEHVAGVVVGTAIELLVQWDGRVVGCIRDGVLIGLARIIAQVDPVAERSARRAADRHRVQAEALSQDAGQIIAFGAVQQHGLVEIRMEVVTLQQQRSLLVGKWQAAHLAQSEELVVSG